MDPLTISSSFATIVSLICNYKSESVQEKANDYNYFIAWLAEKRHNDVIQQLTQNDELSNEIKEIFIENQDILIQKIHALSEQISNVKEIIPSSKVQIKNNDAYENISNQGISILKQLITSGGTTIVRHQGICGTSFIISDSNTSNKIEILDERFAGDDFDVLVKADLLKESLNRSGCKVYTITRAAFDFISNFRQ